MPPFDAPDDDAGRPTVSQIIDKIQCEIAEARDDSANDSKQLNDFLHNYLKLASFGQWVASVTLSLTVNDTGGLGPTSGPTLAYIKPLVPMGTSFMLGGSPVLYQQRTRIYTQTYTIDISTIPRGQTCENMGKRWHNFNLEGDLGLRKQIYMGLHAFDVDDAANFAVKAGSPDSFGATASFDVFKGVTGFGPTWTLVNFQNSGGAGYERDDLNKIAITFVPVAYVPKKVGRFVALRAPAVYEAAERARVANSQLVTTQAIQQLNQALISRR